MELLLPSEVARRLGISEAQARRLIRTGRLPSIVIGGRGWRAVPEEAVQAFERQQNQPETSVTS